MSITLKIFQNIHIDDNLICGPVNSAWMTDYYVMAPRVKIHSNPSQ